MNEWTMDIQGQAIMEEYMTVQEFCRLLRVSQTTAYRMIKEKQIPAVKFGRRYKIPKSMFDRLDPRYAH